MNTGADRREAFEQAQARLREADPHKAFDEAMAELQRSAERLQSVRMKLQAKPTKVTSKDGMVTVTLNERGDVMSIAFNTSKFRRMPPAELGSVLVETIGRARAECRAAVASAYRPFLPEGMDLEKMMSGKFSVDGIFDVARRRGERIMADAQSPHPAEQAARRG